jgi:hypothetical protein
MEHDFFMLSGTIQETVPPPFRSPLAPTPRGNTRLGEKSLHTTAPDDSPISVVQSLNYSVTQLLNHPAIVGLKIAVLVSA